MTTGMSRVFSANERATTGRAETLARAAGEARRYIASAGGWADPGAVREHVLRRTGYEVAAASNSLTKFLRAADIRVRYLYTRGIAGRTGSLWGI